MSLPGQRCEIAWTSGFTTAEGSRTWSDVTSDLRLDPPAVITFGRTDPRSTVGPMGLTCQLDNIDGRYTPGKAGSPNYPNVVKGVPIRITQRDDSNLGNGNLFTANQASVETSVADWSFNTLLGTYTFGTSIAQSTLHPFSGTKGGLATWSTTSSGNYLVTAFDGFVIGRTYTFSMYVYVPTGSPDPRLEVAFVASSARTTTKNSLVRLSVTFVATGRLHFLGVQVASATAGQQCFFDAAMVDEGTSSGTFTTTAPAISTRGTFYADDWNVTWPTGGAEFATCDVVASSRRSRLGQAALLKSAIRTTYLSTSPEACWPMDEQAGVADRNGRQAFRDITNPLLLGIGETELIGAFSNTTALAPVVQDGTPGPTDEGSLVRFPMETDVALLGAYAHYVGQGGGFRLKPSLGITAECVMRANMQPGDVIRTTTLIALLSSDLSQGMFFDLTTINTGAPDVTCEMMSRNQLTFAVVEDQYDFVETPATVDGAVHHCLFTLDSTGKIGKFYFDGALVKTLTFATAAFTVPFTGIAFCSDNLYYTIWVGWGAVHTRVLTPTEIAARAAAATAASEDVAERTTRIGGYLGVPAGEIDAETSVAQPLGAQPEKGNSGTSVLDDLATSTAGILYDTRAGHLAMQARNHRWNAASAFTLSAASEQVEADLNPNLSDDPINAIDVSMASDSSAIPIHLEDAASTAQNGVYGTSAQIISESSQEVEAYGYDVLARNAQPQPRIKKVSVDVTDLDATTKAAVLAADISTLFTLSNLPAQSPATSVDLFVEGGTETLGVKHLIAFNTSGSQYDKPVFVPDDAVYGLLDAGNRIPY